MTEPARAESHLDDVEAARAALGPRIASGDLSALAEYFELGGVRIKSITYVDPADWPE